MARKAGQLISHGPRTWLVRVSLGRDPDTGTRKYHKTIRGSFREAQSYLRAKLQERDIGCLPPRGCDQAGPISRSVARDGGEAEVATEKLHGL
jgi:hypothetical protein